MDVEATPEAVAAAQATAVVDREVVVAAEATLAVKVEVVASRSAAALLASAVVVAEAALVVDVESDLQLEVRAKVRLPRSPHWLKSAELLEEEKEVKEALVEELPSQVAAVQLAPARTVVAAAVLAKAVQKASLTTLWWLSAWTRCRSLFRTSRDSTTVSLEPMRESRQ